MNRIEIRLMSLILAGLLAACSSTPPKEQSAAAVEDRTAVETAAALQASAPSTQANAGAGISGKPLVDRQALGVVSRSQDGAAALKDPANILSKRVIYFELDSNVVREEFKPIVSAHARYLQQNRSTKMSVQGHADERGSREYNLALGQRRADAVKQMMEVLGAKSYQVETVSFGEEKPVAPGHDEDSWSKNRRAELAYPND